MKRSLEINSYRDIKITRIRDYSIHFKHKDRYYFVLESGGCETQVRVYEKLPNNKKFLITSKLRPSFKCNELIRFKKNKTYSQVDLLYFVRKLVSFDLITGEYERWYKEIIKIENEFNIKVEKLKQEKNALIIKMWE